MTVPLLDMGRTRIHRYTSDLLQWNLDTSECHFLTRSGEYSHHEKVDPYPAYPNDFELAEKELSRAAQVFPVSGEVDLYVFSREGVGRTNGYCTCDAIRNYDKLVDGKYPATGWQATIILFGKRIPIHPAMTRYLVAHEYGHAVAWHLAVEKGLDSTREGSFYQEYADMRGCPYYDGDKGGEWHVLTCEIFANDFRVLVLGAEEEFWPHPTAAYPRTLPKLVDFWKQAQAKAWKETDDGPADTFAPA